MPTLAFDVTDRSGDNRHLEFRGKDNADYYEGELGFAGDTIDMRIEKATAGEYPIYRLMSRSGLTFRRTWQHIRRDHTDVTVFWFVRRGSMRVTTSASQISMKGGECGMTRSTCPFFMQLDTDERGSLDILHAVVQSCKTQSILGECSATAKALSTTVAGVGASEKLLNLLFENDTQLDPDMAAQIAEALMKGLSKILAKNFGEPIPRPTIEDHRYREICRVISQNYANQDFDQKMAAQRVGISTRYLCKILSHQDISFSDLLWESRLRQAQDWLKDPQMARYSISEVALLSGFKSSSHFSRFFKTKIGSSPKDYRASGQSDQLQ